MTQKSYFERRARTVWLMNPSHCEVCGRKRPTYTMKNEDDETVFMCGECCAFRQVKDD